MAEISMHGWIAISLGVFFSVAMSIGLFWLTFHSARNGYDDIDLGED